MAATSEINTPERPGSVTRFPVAAATTIYAGTLTALNSAGYLVPASDTPGLRVQGRAEETADNAAGLAGDAACNVKAGVFLFANSTGDAVDANDIGKPCFVEDDQSVAETGDVPAGRVVEVSAEGVWVEVRPAGAAADALTALTFTALGATGPEVEALRDALVEVLAAAGLIH